jgi:hypothetical protein
MIPIKNLLKQVRTDNNFSFPMNDGDAISMNNGLMFGGSNFVFYSRNGTLGNGDFNICGGKGHLFHSCNLILGRNIYHRIPTEHVCNGIVFSWMVFKCVIKFFIMLYGEI